MSFTLPVICQQVACLLLLAKVDDPARRAVTMYTRRRRPGSIHRTRAAAAHRFVEMTSIYMRGRVEDRSASR